VGKNRRRTHTILRSFDNKEQALKFWKLGGNLEAQK
jgi:hypothetical protein